MKPLRWPSCLRLPAVAETPEEHGSPPASLPKRIGWMLLIWAASVAALALVAGLLRLVLARS